MIAQGLSPLLDWHRGRRRRALERVWRDVTQIQERALLALVHNARDTEFGLSHGLASVRSVADYQARVPIREYREFAPFLARAAQGERSVLWSGRTRDWVKTSGATGADKVIPVTREAFTAHRRGGWDAFLMA
ncbi:MAG TPA: GH3 auxin-responsive promoter family protein, partial [Candidatus Methylomirabilis sp.]|nr:GH3 auxin-responsive promoter family protein [Candidatus Methylomirabilis sp.]